VFPLYKTGPKSSPANFRPISKQPILRKVFEKIILSKLYPHVKPLIYNHQYFSIKKKSATANVLVSTSKILNGWENKLTTGILYTDFSKAFDSVEKNLLKYKMKNLFNIHEPLLDVIVNSISNCTFTVNINSMSSSIYQVMCGVSQGGV